MTSDILAMLPGGGDTIAAVATAAGRSAISVVRLSGRESHTIAARLLAPWPLPERQASVCVVRSQRDGSIVDHVVATVFTAPRSYTGEDVVELSAHGGFVAPAAVLATVIDAGARLALPGEFTRRAVLNGKLDLIQAEAVGDLIEARSDGMRRIALRQLDGGLSRRLGVLRDQLLDLDALLAYDIDFPDEDDGPIPRAHITEACDRLLESISMLVATGRPSTLVREGAIVVIAGAPNTGKSSLFNALIGEARAIVTSIPGTTRDALEVAVEHRGWPLRLVDTAGVRDTSDVVERLGIEVSERYLQNADVILACGDTPASLCTVLERIRHLSHVPTLAIGTKSDLWGSGGDLSETAWTVVASPVRAVSAEHRRGLDALLEDIIHALESEYGRITVEQPSLTNARQQTGMERADRELKAFRMAWTAGLLPASVAAVHVRSAAHALEELVGSVDIDDVLARVFATFCVGK
jgi:tRNA modification GTPase